MSDLCSVRLNDSCDTPTMKSIHTCDNEYQVNAPYLKNNWPKEPKCEMNVGFDQGIPPHTEFVFEKWGFFRSNPMGSVTNNDGSLRMINDLSYPRNKILMK